MFETTKYLERHLNDSKVLAAAGFKGITGILVYLKMRM